MLVLVGNHLTVIMEDIKQIIYVHLLICGGEHFLAAQCILVVVYSVLLLHIHSVNVAHVRWGNYKSSRRHMITVKLTVVWSQMCLDLRWDQVNQQHITFRKHTRWHFSDISVIFNFQIAYIFWKCSYAEMSFTCFIQINVSLKCQLVFYFCPISTLQTYIFELALLQVTHVPYCINIPAKMVLRTRKEFI